MEVLWIARPLTRLLLLLLFDVIIDRQTDQMEQIIVRRQGAAGGGEQIELAAGDTNERAAAKPIRVRICTVFMWAKRT